MYAFRVYNSKGNLIYFTKFSTRALAEKVAYAWVNCEVVWGINTVTITQREEGAKHELSNAGV